MEEREQKGGGAGCLIGCVIMFLFAPFGYVLSVGPAWWFSRQFPATNDFLETCYVPLGVLGEAVPPFGEFLKWYMGLWGG